MSKITKDELKSLNEQEKKKAAIRNDLGVLEIQKHSLLHISAEIQIEQDKLKDSLEKSYGKINVDLKDGSYTLVEEKEE
jgi:hypothetical protein|tara:strand:- start:251 stop:487 length:237 start_codon:yes stop_codon:yes gene_type:complete